MAITTKEFLEKQAIISSTILLSEIEAVDRIEKWLDEEITKYFDTLRKKISIQLCFVDFSYDPIKKISTNYSETSKKRMFAELQKRYINAGWKVEIDGGDSMSMNAQQYLILYTE